MTARILAAVALTAGVAAILARAVADALADIDAALQAYAVELPDYVPESFTTTT